MTNDAFIEENFARWMEPAMLEQPPERIGLFRDATVSVAEDLGEHELSAVLACNGVLSDDIVAWLGRHLREKDESFVVEGKDDLVQRVAGIAVLRRVSDARDESAILAALALLSARYAGLKPIIAELPEIATQRLREMGSEVRARDRVEPLSLAPAVKNLPPARKPNEETGAAVDVNQLAADVALHAKAIKALITSLEPGLAAASERQRALDEEVEMLWWVIRDQDSEGRPWGDRPVVERAVCAAVELADRTEILPGPPSAEALLRRLLTEDADADVSFAEFAVEVSRKNLATDTSSAQPLIPILSSSAICQEFRTDKDDKTWRGVIVGKLNIQSDRLGSIADGAVQLYRELQMLRLLPND